MQLRTEARPARHLFFSFLQLWVFRKQNFPKWMNSQNGFSCFQIVYIKWGRKRFEENYKALICRSLVSFKHFTVEKSAYYSHIMTLKTMYRVPFLWTKNNSKKSLKIIKINGLETIFFSFCHQKNNTQKSELISKYKERRQSLKKQNNYWG